MQENKPLKYLVLLLICASINFSFTTQDNPVIVGLWHVEYITYEDSKESGRKFLNFKEDGTLNGGRIGEQPNKFGFWVYNSETKVMTLSDKDPEKDDDLFTLKSITNNTMVLANNFMAIHLVRQQQ